MDALDREFLDRLRAVTAGCRDDMHEPDEQGIDARVTGYRLDNAMGDDPHSNIGEYTVGIVNTVTDRTEWFNLATLIAMARRAV